MSSTAPLVSPLASGIGLACVVLAIAVAAVPSRPWPRRTVRDAVRIRARGPSVVAAWSRRTSTRPPTARDVAAWCDDVARRVRAGSSLREAVAILPADPATEHATAPLRLALERGTNLAEAAARAGDAGPHLRLALSVIATAARLGGPSAASIDRTAMLLRQRATDSDERATQAAQARLSAHVMTAVPLLMLAVLVVTDGDVRSAAASTTGAILVVTGLVLNAVGWWWMRRIIGAAT
jgi:Flp pilus assembly protein TadB